MTIEPPVNIPVQIPASIGGRGSPPLVFVGGSGRSGTHIVAELLGRHRLYADVAIEARFHAKPQGFPDLLDGSAGRDQFVRKLKRFWWHRVAAGEFAPWLLPRFPLGRSDRGLSKILPRERLETAIASFEARHDDDPDGACRNLFLDLLWPIAAEAGRPGLIEMTTDNVIQGRTLARLFPEAKFVLTVRDGRDSGTSKASRRQRRHHPTDTLSGIEWWLERMLRVEQGAAAIPADRLLVISLDELVSDQRESVYAELLGFLALRDRPRIRRFFDDQMSPANAHRARWRSGLDDAAAAKVIAAYDDALQRLERSGAQTAAILRRDFEADRG